MIVQPQSHSASFSRSADIAGTSEEAWARTCRRLRTELGEAVYNSWFARLELVRIDSGVAYLSVPTKFLKSWIQAHYMDRIRTILSGEFGLVERLSVEVRSSSKFRSPLRQTELERKHVVGAGAAPSGNPSSNSDI